MFDLKSLAINAPRLLLKPQTYRWPWLSLQLLCLTSRYVTHPLPGSNPGPALHFPTLLALPELPLPGPYRPSAAFPLTPQRHTLELADIVHVNFRPPWSAQVTRPELPS